MILIALLLSFTLVLRPPTLRDPVPGTSPVVASGETFHGLSTAGVLKASESAWPLFAHTNSSKGATSKTDSVDRHGKVPSPSTHESVELEHVSQYLDNPDLRRIFLVAGVTDEATQKQVANVVEETTRFNYFKITIDRGIVIDPRHPDEATVFALVVSPTELETLRSRLRRTLQDRVEEAPIDPMVVTQLADIGQVQACPPAPVADVEIPRIALAMKVLNEDGDDEAVPRGQLAASDRSPTPFQERSSPAAELAKSHPVESPNQSFIVLVWVSRARPG